MGLPTPGCPNDCSGASFILEDHIEAINEGTAKNQSHYSSENPCKSQYSVSSYKNLSAGKVATYRDKLTRDMKKMSTVEKKNLNLASKEFNKGTTCQFR